MDAAPGTNLPLEVIVYGDPKFKTTSRELVEQIRELDSAAGDAVDVLRSTLIVAGQLEQAAEDGDLHKMAMFARHITDFAAAAFYSAWVEHRREPMGQSRLCHDFQHLQALLDGMSEFSNEPLIVKVPEGFEFYALYPEQYCMSAAAWSTNHKPSNNRSVLIIGVRSIGATLSALVGATLTTFGWRCKRITVRPIGPPFDRITNVSEDVGRYAAAIVVDEGPGMSGSSMASVAKALIKNGFEPGQISFFPGHNGQPGTAASSETQKIWEIVQTYATPLETVRWMEKTLVESLHERSAEIALDGGTFGKVEDLSCGRWREKVYGRHSEWPWVPVTFERMKFRCTSSNGKSLLWKFCGLGEPGFLKQAGLSERWTAPACAWHRGFVAYPWMEGSPLSLADGNDPVVVKKIGEYICEASKSPLTASAHLAALDRLREMLYWNVKEAMGPELAARARDFGNANHKNHACRTYGDGHMSPHEWVRTSQGKILKLDNFGHDCDHTVIGAQTIYWDVAGAIVEWCLSSPKPLLSSIKESRIMLQPDILKFHELAYAAFRMGQAAMCADAAQSSAAELARTRAAFAYYRSKVRTILDCPDI